MVHNFFPKCRIFYNVTRQVSHSPVRNIWQHWSGSTWLRAWQHSNIPRHTFYPLCYNTPAHLTHSSKKQRYLLLKGIYSHLSSERCPAACTPPKDIPWKLQNQRQPAACCWPGNAAQRILRWASGCGVCWQTQCSPPSAREAKTAPERAW